MRYRITQRGALLMRWTAGFALLTVGACHAASGGSAGTTPASTHNDANNPNSPAPAAKTPGNDQAQLPVPTTGTYLVDYQSARVRCDYQPGAAALLYSVHCLVVARQASGSEFAATQLQAGVDLSWQRPAQIRGAATILSCNTASDNLSQSCSIGVGQSVNPAELGFAFSIQDNQNPVRTEATTVVLPYSVGVAAGNVPYIPYNYVSQSQFLSTGGPSGTGGSGRSGAAGVPVGFQQADYGAAQATFASRSLCTRAGRLFYSSGNSVFEIKAGRVVLYAGSANVGNISNTSAKLRVFLDPASIACASDGVYVASAQTAIIHRLHDDGSVDVIADGTRPGTTADGKVGAGFPIQGLANIALTPADDLVFMETGGADSGGHKLRQLSAAGMLRTIAASGATGGIVANGDAMEPFNDPRGLVVAGDGSIYVADYADQVVRKVSPSGVVSIVAGTGVARYTASSPAGSLANPISLALGADGSLYIGESLRGVKKLGPSRQLSQVVSAGPDIPSTIADLAAQPFAYRPTIAGRPVYSGLIVTADGALLTDAPYGLWQYPKGATTPVPLVGSLSEPVPVCTSAVDPDKLHLHEGSALALTRDHRIVVVDWQADASYQLGIRQILPEGGNLVSQPLAGCTPSPLLRVDDQAATSLVFPTSTGSLVPAADGSFYWSNPYQNIIVKVATDGSLSTFAGTGTAASTGDGGQARNAGLAAPDGLALGKDGSLYVAERDSAGTSKIRRISPNGIITTVAGSGAAGDSGEGQAATMAQIGAKAVAVGNDGRIFIADFDNGKIKMVDSAGLIHTIAGGGSALPELGSIPALSAAISSPTSIAVTASGVVYFVNQGQNRVDQLVQNSDVSWQLSTFFGTKNQNDCGTGYRQGEATSASAVAGAIKSSLAIICAGQVQTVVVNDTCPASGGDTRILISQSFFQTHANIIEIVKPCT